jgi:fatty acid desaturase
MTELTAEHKEEPKQEKKRFNFKIRGSNTGETLENVSFYVIVISAIMVAIGVGLGSFIQGTILLSVLGAFFVMIGIIIYIISQFLGESNG